MNDDARKFGVSFKVIHDDPVDRPDFNPNTYREPNPETIANIRRLARRWRAAVEVANDIRAELDDAVRDAKASGHSFPQLREATGFGTSTIQMILAKGWKDDA